MTKSDAIRKALRGGALTLDQLRAKVERSLKQIVGKQKLYALLTTMQAAKEIDSAGRGETRVYVLMPGKRGRV